MQRAGEWRGAGKLSGDFNRQGLPFGQRPPVKDFGAEGSLPMSFEQIRFVHASNVGLDSPIRTTDVLPARVIDDFEQARLHSFERVISACIDRKVDFLSLIHI